MASAHLQCSGSQYGNIDHVKRSELSLSSAGVYKAAEARLLLLMYQVNYVNQGNQLKDSAVSPAKIVEDSWTMDGFVSLSGN